MGRRPHELMRRKASEICGGASVPIGKSTGVVAAVLEAGALFSFGGKSGKRPMVMQCSFVAWAAARPRTVATTCTG